MGSYTKDYTPPTTENRFKTGIDYQRERFKAGKNGTGSNNSDLMADAIENIKSEIKHKAIMKGLKKEIQQVEKILLQYRTLELKYVRRTPQGNQVVYPPNIEHKVNIGLTSAYEILMKVLAVLQLI
jgi:hypothetical protein